MAFWKSVFFVYFSLKNVENYIQLKSKFDILILLIANKFKRKFKPSFVRKYVYGATHDPPDPPLNDLE